MSERILLSSIKSNDELLFFECLEQLNLDKTKIPQIIQQLSHDDVSSILGFFVTTLINNNLDVSMYCPWIEAICDNLKAYDNTESLIIDNLKSLYFLSQMQTTGSYYLTCLHETLHKLSTNAEISHLKHLINQAKSSLMPCDDESEALVTYEF